MMPGTDIGIQIQKLRDVHAKNFTHPHLFGLTNPDQVSDALSIPKARLYRELNTMSLYLWQHLFVRIGCSIALEAIREAVSKSASTLSRLCILISVDDTFVFRYGEDLAYIADWWSSQANQPMKGQNILRITIKIGERIIPLNMRLISKQGRGNTDKPSCVISMLKEVVSFFEETGTDIRNYPITFDSWYGSRHLIDTLQEMGFETILVHGKSNYVMTIDEKRAKLSEHKKSIEILGEFSIKRSDFIKQLRDLWLNFVLWQSHKHLYESLSGISPQLCSGEYPKSSFACFQS